MDPTKSENRSDKARQYLDRAKVLAHRASDSENPETRVAYLELAQQWAALAEHVHPQTSETTPKPAAPRPATGQAGNPSRR